MTRPPIWLPFGHASGSDRRGVLPRRPSGSAPRNPATRRVGLFGYQRFAAPYCSSARCWFVDRS